MTDHKPRLSEVRQNIQAKQPDNVRIFDLRLGTTIYERKQGVMRAIGWRMSYQIVSYQFESGRPVEKSFEEVETVHMK